VRREVREESKRKEQKMIRRGGVSYVSLLFLFIQTSLYLSLPPLFTSLSSFSIFLSYDIFA